MNARLPMLGDIERVALKRRVASAASIALLVAAGVLALAAKTCADFAEK